jgi:hypothetical protein
VTCLGAAVSRQKAGQLNRFDLSNYYNLNFRRTFPSFLRAILRALSHRVLGRVVFFSFFTLLGKQELSQGMKIPAHYRSGSI